MIRSRLIISIARRFCMFGSPRLVWIIRDENSNNSVEESSDPRKRKILIYLTLEIPPLGTTIFQTMPAKIPEF